MSAKSVLIHLKAYVPGLTCPPATPPCLKLFLQDLEFTLSCKVPVPTFLYLKKVTLLFCPGEAQKTSQIFSRTYKQNSRTFQDSKTIQDFSRMCQPWQLLCLNQGIC